MTKFPALSGKKLVKILKKSGFELIRTKGSHNFLRHPDGRSTTVPVHSNETLGTGILSKILKDCELNRNDII